MNCDHLRSARNCHADRGAADSRLARIEATDRVSLDITMGMRVAIRHHIRGQGDLTCVTCILDGLQQLVMNFRPLVEVRNLSLH